MYMLTIFYVSYNCALTTKKGAKYKHSEAFLHFFLKTKTYSDCRPSLIFSFSKAYNIRKGKKIKTEYFGSTTLIKHNKSETKTIFKYCYF